jgi:hypothetical protein
LIEANRLVVAERDLHVWKQVYDKADKEKSALESRLGVVDRDEKQVKVGILFYSSRSPHRGILGGKPNYSVHH